jgi:hypothetical protein
MSSEEFIMPYAVLGHYPAGVVGSRTKEQNDAVMAKLAVVEAKLVKEGRLGPVARLKESARSGGAAKASHNS